jgi:hypothetical protein
MDDETLSATELKLAEELSELSKQHQEALASSALAFKALQIIRQVRGSPPESDETVPR